MTLKQKSLADRAKDTEFGFLHNQKTIKQEAVCLKVDDQYAIHLIKNDFDQKALVANIHFPSAASMDEHGQKRFTRLLSELNELKSVYGCDDLIIGGDLNVALITGPKAVDQKDKEYSDKIDEIQNNIEVIGKILADQADMSFSVSLPSKAIKKVRMPGDITKNNQASVKSGETITDSQIVIHGSASHLSDNKVVFYRGNVLLKDTQDFNHCVDPNPTVFDLMDKDRCFDHEILSTRDDFNSKFSKLYFVNALETTRKGPKGVVENRFNGTIDPEVTSAWTKQVIAFAIDAAEHANPENKKQKLKKVMLTSHKQAEDFLDHFFDKFYGAETAHIIDNVKDDFKPKVAKEALSKELWSKINKKLKKDGACPIHQLITTVGQEFTQSTPGGFSQTPAYFEKLEELGPNGMTAFIEAQQAEKIQRLIEAENAPVFVFLTECEKDYSPFCDTAKSEMRNGLLDLSNPEEAAQYDEAIRAFRPGADLLLGGREAFTVSYKQASSNSDLSAIAAPSASETPEVEQPSTKNKVGIA